MTSRFGVALIATIALASGRAYAAGAVEHDDTSYPEPASTWSGAVGAQSSPHLTYDDTRYPAAHTTIRKELLSATAARALASSDDTAYPAADERRAPQARVAQERVACGCTDACAHHG